jgi:hypothetical protein
VALPLSRDKKDGASPAQQRRGARLRRPVYCVLPLDLPVCREEIQMVLEALGSDIAALFDEEK